LEKPLDVLVIGELNVDLILNKIASFPVVGKEILADEMLLTMGSSSAIFACNLSSLGTKVGFLGALGNDTFGNLVIEGLQKKGVDTNLIRRNPAYHTGATISLSYGEDRANITYAGAMALLSHTEIGTSDLAKARHLHLSSYFLQPALQAGVAQIFKNAKAAGLTTSLDPQWDPAEKWDMPLEEILPYTDVFLPNEQEILRLTQTTHVNKALSTISGFARIVAVKMGNKGSLVWHQGKVTERPPFLNPAVVDAIGAGDSFNAGFIHQFIRQADLEKCQEFGNLTGAISTTAAGGTTAFESYEQIMHVAKTKFGFTF
jgi:sugar/nucleoside kinase (ribokinase family)